MGDCPNDVRESEISPDATFLKIALDAKLETGKPQNFTPRVGTANSITWWISISSSQVHEKCMKTEFHLNSRGFGSVPFVCVQHVFR